MRFPSGNATDQEIYLTDPFIAYSGLTMYYCWLRSIRRSSTGGWNIGLLFADSCAFVRFWGEFSFLPAEILLAVRSILLFVFLFSNPWLLWEACVLESVVICCCALNCSSARPEIGLKFIDWFATPWFITWIWVPLFPALVLSCGIEWVSSVLDRTADYWGWLLGECSKFHLWEQIFFHNMLIPTLQSSVTNLTLRRTTLSLNPDCTTPRTKTIFNNFRRFGYEYACLTSERLRMCDGSCLETFIAAYFNCVNLFHVS